MSTNHLTFYDDEDSWPAKVKSGDLVINTWPGNQVGYGIVLQNLGMTEIGMGVFEVLTSTGKIINLTTAVIHPIDGENIPDWVHEYLNTGTWVGPNAWRLKVQP